jgi:hypothetical protein
MNTFISKAAAVLLVPVILGTSCFSCLMTATPASAAAPHSPEMSMDQSMHTAHATECSRTHNQTNFEAKQPQPTDIHHAMIGRVFNVEKIFLTRHRPHIRSPRFSPKDKNFLTGTTIKKE